MVAIQRERIKDRVPMPVGVSDGYRHYRKRIVPREFASHPPVTLKWYDIEFLEFPVADALQKEARTCVAHELSSSSFATSGEVGFVILHDCGDVVFLLISTWRGNNELWETVYVKYPDLGGTFKLHRENGDHHPTYCVWELGAVVHESHAWTRYLSSERTNDDLETYLADQFAGEI